LSGRTVDFFTTTSGARNWTGFWLASGLSAFAILLYVAVFFHSGGKVQNKQAPPLAADA